MTKRRNVKTEENWRRTLLRGKRNVRRKLQKLMHVTLV
jgi:hypothetical protein